MNKVNSDVLIRPGINNRIDTSKIYHLEDRSVLRTLSKQFYITRSVSIIKVGNSDYRYFFLKFPNDKSEIFGVTHEVIVLLSPFDNFEPRTLDAIESIEEKITGFRLDKICAFVVSGDRFFLDKIKKIIKTQKECRLIVPLTYDELNENSDDNFFRDRIREFFFERNLYDLAQPLRKDLYFFGRDGLCQNLIDKHNTGQSTSLFGLRRSGKTSILLALKRRIEAHKGFVSIIDCQLLHLLSWNDALYHVADSLNKDHKAKVKINKEDYSEKSAALHFMEDVKKIRSKLGKHILIAFDEIEHITFSVSPSIKWRDGSDYIKFWHVIRVLFQSYDYPITILLCGTNPKCLEIPYIDRIDNPLFGQITPEYIPGFDVPQSKQMLGTLSSYMGIEIDEDVYTYMVREFGGHPFLMRQFCSTIKTHLAPEKNHKIDRPMYSKYLDIFNNGAGFRFCEMVIGVLLEHYRDEYTMLTYLARGDIEDFNGLAESDRSYTTHLIGYGVIVRSSEGFDFNIDSIKSYLESKEKYKKLNMSNDDKLKEIGERRNDVEKKLRKIVSRILMLKYGQEQAKNIILSKHNEERKRKYSSLSYKELFDPNKHEVYFDDLRKIISKNWNDYFENVFSGNVEQFDSRMKILNSIGRSDAHAKNVTDSEMQMFRGAMTLLEENVNDYLE